MKKESPPVRRALCFWLVAPQTADKIRAAACRVRAGGGVVGGGLLPLQEVDRRCGDCLMYVSAAEAGAVCAVPIAFDDHGATAAGAGSWERRVHAGWSLPEVHRRATAGAEALRLPGPWIAPHSVAYGVSCRVRAERLPYSLGESLAVASPRLTRFTPVRLPADAGSPAPPNGFGPVGAAAPEPCRPPGAARL